MLCWYVQPMDAVLVRAANGFCARFYLRRGVTLFKVFSFWGFLKCCPTTSGAGAGREHFFGSGTKNAQTDFNDTDAPTKIRDAIDNYLNNVIPGQSLTAICFSCAVSYNTDGSYSL